MSLTVYCGNMFSGKTTELLKEVTKYSDLSKERCSLIINHSSDTRDINKVVSSHSSIYKGLSDKVDVVSSPTISDIDVSDYTIIGLDEANFYPDLVQGIQKWLDLDKHIICAGLDGDFKMNAFGDISKLLHLADKFIKLNAVCSICMKETADRGEIITPCNAVPAAFTKKISGNTDTVQIDIGGADKYIAVCRKHHK